MRPGPVRVPCPSLFRSRLFQLDLLIVLNGLKAGLARWNDRLIAGAVLVTGVVALRSGLVHLARGEALFAALAAGLVTGCATGRALNARLDFHSAEGPLAAHALMPASRRRYLMAWHLVAMGLIAIVTILVSPPLLVGLLVAHSAGAVTSHALASMGPSRLLRSGHAGRWSRAIGSCLQQPRSGLRAAALLAACLVLCSIMLSRPETLAVVGAITVLLVLALTRVDSDAVQFAALMGEPPLSGVLRHARGVALFAGLSVSIGTLGLSPSAGALAGSISLIGMLLMTLRVLAYRIHPRRRADLLISGVAVIAALTASAVPFILPLLLGLILWRLHQQASARTWTAW